VLTSNFAIAFDDAGTGNVLGGAVIGAVQGNGFRSKIIGPEWFSFGSALKPIISSAVIELLLTLRYENNFVPEKVVLCRSDLFDSSEHDLRRLGYTVERASIVGTLQKMIEEEFMNYLISLGLPPYALNLLKISEKNKMRCYRALNEFSLSYIMAFPEKRILLAKQNCSTFKRLHSAVIERKFFKRLKGRQRRCVECGENIRSDAFKCEGAGRIFYVHERCAKWE